MPGVKGAGGPPPKRSDQRRRRNKPAAGAVTKSRGRRAQMPAADESWHPVALAWYRALGESGQAAFYQASDWATAFAAAETLSRELHPQPMVVGNGADARVEMHKLPVKAATLAAFLKSCTSLLATEGDRRRAAIELEEPESDKGSAEGGSSVSSLDAWRGRTGGAG
jgi:hypothetical protein